MPDEWTPEEIAKEKAKRVEYIKMTGRCPARETNVRVPM